MNYCAATFENRWVITGTLTNESLLHLGSGDITTRKELVDEKDRRPVQVKAVFTDHQGRACLLGSSLRGVLRERLAALLGQPGLTKDQQHLTVMKLFGKPEPRGADERARINQAGHGGRLAVHDALVAVEPFSPPANWHAPPFWDARRRTGVASGVALNRRTRTAAAQKLFHYEFVPPGVAFSLKLTGENLDDADIAHLLRALDEFNPDSANPLTLGADTGNGWGRLRWTLREVRRLTAAEVRQALDGWLKNPASLSPSGNVAKSRTFALTAVSLPSLPATFRSFTLKLLFDGPFLVKRPAKPKAKGDTDTPNAQPHLDERGHVMLPAASFRGALRAQAERILRTMALAFHPNLTSDELERLAPDPTATAETLRDHQWNKLSLTGRIFGASGWRSPVDVTDFTEQEAPYAELFMQDFLAIDRFTGGGKDGAKFKFQAAFAPRLTGQITLRFRPDTLEAELGPGLLALTLRDVLEGDVTFGLGAGKGYGACRGESAEILQWLKDTATTASVDSLREYVREQKWKQAKP
jgi:CRISPR/Cas system CSM-associated protein Csm3 (group 7 of RAMP superfamily)